MTIIIMTSRETGKPPNDERNEVVKEYYSSTTISGSENGNSCTDEHNGEREERGGTSGMDGRAGRGGRGRRGGRGNRGGRGGRGSRRSGRSNHNQAQNAKIKKNGRKKNENSSNTSRNSNRKSPYQKHNDQKGHTPFPTNDTSLTDEDILIAFAPLLRSGNVDAVKIHERFGQNSDNAQFISSARELIMSLSFFSNSQQQQQQQHQKHQTQKIDDYRQQNAENETISIPKETGEENRSMENASASKPQTQTDLISSSQSQTSRSKSISPLNEHKPKSNALRTNTVSENPNSNPTLKYNNVANVNFDKNVLPDLSSPPRSLEPNEPSPHTHSDVVSQQSQKSQESNSNRIDIKSLKDDNSDDPQIQHQQMRKPEKTTKVYHQPRRLFRNQPGTLSVLNNTNPAKIILKPRSGFTTKWSIPLEYLRIRSIEQSKREIDEKNANESKISNDSNFQDTTKPNVTLRDALQSLTIGLFRFGCPENGNQFAIVAKEVLDTGVFQIQNNSICGEVPFYAPRSPGNVILRMYFNNDALQTLATGPVMTVEVRTIPDTDSTLRFLLSNFKSKKGPNVSTMHSLSLVFSSFTPPPPSHYPQSSSHHHDHHGGSPNLFDGAGRAAWGCVCESKKSTDMARIEFERKIEKLKEQEEELNKWKEMYDDATKHEEMEDGNNRGDVLAIKANQSTSEHESTKTSGSKVKENDEKAMNLEKWKEKIGDVMREKVSVERKWRDVQLAYASVVKAALLSNSCALLLRRDILTKLRLEYELWCPICEAFAPNPFLNKQSGTSSNTGSTHVFPYPYPITPQHFRQCVQSRNEFQVSMLGFLPRTETLQQLLAHKGSAVAGKVIGQGRPITSGNTALQRLSTVMNRLYTNSLCPSRQFYDEIAVVRDKIEAIVIESKAFPPGTKVVLFGSIANGFSSPDSDVDMCIELPRGSQPNSLDLTGSNAMSTLAETLTKCGMKDVNTSRLSARIPIIMFEFPFELISGFGNRVLQCDVSMHNPLACLNTALLKSYSTIDPRICVLASIIKLWAKRRNINDPSHHTLSSYGYIIMLLHFLTKTNSLSTSSQSRSDEFQPVVPNLQWIDRNSIRKNQYCEISSKPIKPQFLLRHPREKDFVVNCYFIQPNDFRSLQWFPSKNLNIGFLLASFFRYFALEFDYKNHVVSLNSNGLRALIEKESKAESDGWKLGTSASILAIEDPFETFYDVAHVLKPSSFQKVKKEFVYAYSKIVDIIWKGKFDDANIGNVLLDALCEEVMETK